MEPNTTSAPSPGTIWLVVRLEPTGEYTAEVAGIPQIRVTAATRDLAIEEVRNMLAEWVTKGQLVAISGTSGNPWLRLAGSVDPHDPCEQEFLEELARFRQEDLERTVREYGLENDRCSSTSSTPTT